MDAVSPVPAERLRQLRLHRRRLLPRRLQGRAHLGRARRPQRQRVRGLQQVREPEEPAAHRGLHHGRHRLGDVVGLRHHRHHDRPGQPAQVRRLRRRLGRHAGDRRPGAVLQLPDRLHRAVRVRRARARLGALRLAAELPAVAGQRAVRDQADVARTCARPCGTGTSLRRPRGHDVRPVHRRAGVQLRRPGDHPLDLARGERVLRHPPRPEQRHRAAARVGVQHAGGLQALRRHRRGDGHRHPRHDQGAGRRGRAGRRASGCCATWASRSGSSTSRRTRYSKNRLGQGPTKFYENAPTIIGDAADVDRITNHVLGDACTPGQRQGVHLRDGAPGGRPLHERRPGRPAVAERTYRRVPPSAGAASLGRAARDARLRRDAGSRHVSEDRSSMPSRPATATQPRSRPSTRSSTRSRARLHRRHPPRHHRLPASPGWTSRC